MSWCWFVVVGSRATLTIYLVKVLLNDFFHFFYYFGFFFFFHELNTRRGRRIRVLSCFKIAGYGNSKPVPPPPPPPTPQMARSYMIFNAYRVFKLPEWRIPSYNGFFQGIWKTYPLGVIFPGRFPFWPRPVLSYMGGGPKTVEKIKITQIEFLFWNLHIKLGSATYHQFFDLRYSIGATADRLLLIRLPSDHHSY